MCGDEIASTTSSYQRVTGWERRRRVGGTNQVVLRETRDEFACGRCVDAARAGRLNQAAIL